MHPVVDRLSVVSDRDTVWQLVSTIIVRIGSVSCTALQPLVLTNPNSYVTAVMWGSSEESLLIGRGDKDCLCVYTGETRSIVLPCGT